VNGHVIHYRVHEQAAEGSPPVVLLHGLAVSHRYLTPTARALTADHRVYVPDLVGFGLSSKPRVVFDVRQHARHLAAWLEELGLPTAYVLGHSFGAEVAVELAARYPRRVAGLILAGLTSDPTARSRVGMIGRWLLDLTREDPRQIPIMLRDMYDARPRRVLATLGHSVRNVVEARLLQVKAPTLLIRGTRDPIAPGRWLAQAARLCPGTATAQVPGAAHNVATTAAPQMAREVRRFTAGIAAARRRQS
jgi:pimeloyl-ACP methyl ester carboxylesterase